MRKTLLSSLVHYCLFVIFATNLCCCSPKANILEPCITYIPPSILVETLPSAFDPLTPEEKKEDWGKELLIANSFGKDMDLYRAITGYTRAKTLLPCNRIDRLQQIEYDIIVCYYLGGRYQDVIETFECSSLKQLSPGFPALKNLLLILYDSYQNNGDEERASFYFKLIEKFSSETAQDVTLFEALSEADFDAADAIIDENPCYEEISIFLANYRSEAKSVGQAQLLNALLPGAGYYYVGQKKSALTSFVINALFTAAAYQFFHKGYVAAGIITTSFEMGWYVGGINGAGLAAKEYNELYYSTNGKTALTQSRLFPILMFETTF